MRKRDLVEMERPEPAKTAPLPSLCRIVQYRGFASEAYDGQDWHPAVITRVHSNDPLSKLNLKVLFDTGPIENRIGIEHESKGVPRAWRWPPRI